MAARIIDGFIGTDAQYIAFLEGEVLKCRRQLTSVHEPTPPNHDESPQQGRPNASNSSHTDDNTPISTPPPSPSSLAVSNQSKTSQQDDPGFRIELYQPDAERAGQRPTGRLGKRPRLLPVTRKTWKQYVDDLKVATPLASDWRRVLEESGIDRVMAGDAATFLLDKTHSVPDWLGTSQRRTSNNPFVAHLFAYAESAISRANTASMTKMLANFQQLLLLSACAVLREKEGLDKDSLNEVVRIINGDCGERYCNRMMDTALYINTLMNTLTMHGYQHRAPWLFLIWNHPPSYYYPLSCSSAASSSALQEGLTAAEFVNMPDGPNEYQTPLFIPLLVSNILQQKYQ